MNCIAASHGHSELYEAALLKAVWWGMRLASLLTHLLFIYLTPKAQGHKGLLYRSKGHKIGL